MFEEIESVFRKVRELKYFNIHYCSFSIVTLIIIYISRELSGNIFVGYGWGALTIFLLVFLYVVIKVCIINKKYKDGKFKEKLIKYLKATKQSRIDDIIKILREYNIINREDIKYLIEYYKEKVCKRKNTWTISDGLAIFFGVMNLINFQDSQDLAIGFIILFLILTIFILYKTFIFFINLVYQTTNVLYNEIYKSLYEIYFDYDNFFNTQ